MCTGKCLHELSNKFMKKKIQLNFCVYRICWPLRWKQQQRNMDIFTMRVGTMKRNRTGNNSVWRKNKKRLQNESQFPMRPADRMGCLIEWCHSHGLGHQCSANYEWIVTRLGSGCNALRTGDGKLICAAFRVQCILINMQWMSKTFHSLHELVGSRIRGNWWASACNAMAHAMFTRAKSELKHSRRKW